jgi:hypothetical protein
LSVDLGAVISTSSSLSSTAAFDDDGGGACCCFVLVLLLLVLDVGVGVVIGCVFARLLPSRLLTATAAPLSSKSSRSNAYTSCDSATFAVGWRVRAPRRAPLAVAPLAALLVVVVVVVAAAADFAVRFCVHVSFWT